MNASVRNGSMSIKQECVLLILLVAVGCAVCLLNQLCCMITELYAYCTLIV
jgi:hypothetical protein